MQLVDEGKSVDVYPHFSKAFNTLSHSISWSNWLLVGLDVCTVHWCWAWRVVMSGAKSSWQALTSTAPQASALRPLLFNTFINALGERIERIRSVHWQHRADLLEGRKALQGDLDGLHWQVRDIWTRSGAGSCTWVTATLCSATDLMKNVYKNIGSLDIWIVIWITEYAGKILLE